MPRSNLGDNIDRRIAARERERERARERYQAKRINSPSIGDQLRPGRPTASIIERLRPVMIGETVHQLLVRKAGSMSYTKEGGAPARRVSMRELVEAALRAQYPEFNEPADGPETPEQAVAKDAELMSEIVLRALAGLRDPENNWNGAGAKIAIECVLPGPPPQGTAQFKLADLAYYLFRKMQKDEPTDHITTVRELVKDMVGW